MGPNAGEALQNGGANSSGAWPAGPRKPSRWEAHTRSTGPGGLWYTWGAEDEAAGEGQSPCGSGTFQVTRPRPRATAPPRKGPPHAWRSAHGPPPTGPRFEAHLDPRAHGRQELVPDELECVTGGVDDSEVVLIFLHLQALWGEAHRGHPRAPAGISHRPRRGGPRSEGCSSLRRTCQMPMPAPRNPKPDAVRRKCFMILEKNTVASHRSLPSHTAPLPVSQSPGLQPSHLEGQDHPWPLLLTAPTRRAQNLPLHRLPHRTGPAQSSLTGPHPPRPLLRRTPQLQLCSTVASPTVARSASGTGLSSVQARTALGWQQRCPPRTGLQPHC